MISIIETILNYIAQLIMDFFFPGDGGLPPSSGSGNNANISQEANTISQRLENNNPFDGLTNIDLINSLDSLCGFDNLSVKYTHGLEIVGDLKKQIEPNANYTEIDYNQITKFKSDNERITNTEYHLNFPSIYYNYQINTEKTVPKGHLVLNQNEQLFYLPIEPESNGIWIDVIEKNLEYLYPVSVNSKNFLYGLTAKNNSDYTRIIEENDNRYKNLNIKLMFVENSLYTQNNEQIFSLYKLHIQEYLKVMEQANLLSLAFNIHDILNNENYSSFTKDSLLCHILKNTSSDNKNLIRKSLIDGLQEFPVIFQISELFKKNNLVSFNSADCFLIIEEYLKLDIEIQVALQDKNNPFYVMAKKYTKSQLIDLLDNLNQQIIIESDKAKLMTLIKYTIVLTVMLGVSVSTGIYIHNS